jgi:hypothetical protein
VTSCTWTDADVSAGKQQEAVFPTGSALLRAWLLQHIATEPSFCG